MQLEFSDGQQRWCYFVTPQILSQFGGVEEFGAERLLSYHASHMIVVSAITRETIERSLAYIQSQGEMLNCSQPLGETLPHEDM